MEKLIAKTYAKALFEVASDEEKYDVVGNELLFVFKCLEDEPELYQILKNPLVVKSEKKEILNSIFKGNISQEVLNFLYIIVDKKREKHIESIVKEYIALVNDAKNIMEAVAITAVPLNNEMLIKLQEILSKYSGKSVQLKNKIDTEVIGGVIVKAGDKVIDGTIKKRLEQMQMQMSQVKY